MEAAASSAKTVTVTFDGVVDTTSATAIKLSRGTTDITVTAAYADDAKSVILTSDTTLAAGTYTVTVGSFAPASFNVTKQTPTALKIANSKVANKDGARVYFEVVDQYGDVMSNYTANKLSVTAYNVTKGHAIYANTSTKKDYFTLACSTENLSNTGYLNAVGDKVSVVAYLKDNASVACTTELEITRIYTDSLTFGEIKLGDDKRVTVNRTYEIEYTAKDTEDKDVTFDEQSASGETAATVSIDYYNFISSNVSAVNMGDVFVDSEGRLKFVAGNTAGTATITAINTITGATTDIKIVVNNTAKLSSVDIADASVACNASTGDKFKAAVTAYDQFGEVIDAKNVKNVVLSTGAPSYFNSITATPTGNIQINKITSDGKYVEYEVVSSLTAMKNQTVTFNFVSKEMGETGYIKSSSIVTIDDEIEAAALDIVKAPDATVTEGGKVNVQFSVKDQYQNKMALTTTNGGIAYTGDYVVSCTNSNGVVSSAAMTTGDGDKVYKLELTAPMISDLSKSGSFTLKLTDGGRTIASKLFNLVIVDSITKYSVSTDADKYKAGDTIKVTVDAYSADGFNANYNGSADVNIAAAGKNYTKTLKFENGVATFELTAGTAGTGYTVTVTNKNDATITAASDAYEVKGNAAGKLTVDAASGNFRITDSEGNETTTTATKTFATIKVTDETMNKDITGDVTVAGWTLNDDKTVEVELDGDNIVTKIAGATYSLATGLSITGVPATSNNHNIVFAITINGFTWESKIAAGTSGSETVTDTGAVNAAANQDATDAVVAAWTTGKSITGAGTTVTDAASLKTALAAEYTTAGYDIEIIIVTEPTYADTETGTYKVKVTNQTNSTTATTGELTVTLAS